MVSRSHAVEECHDAMLADEIRYEWMEGMDSVFEVGE